MKAPGVEIELNGLDGLNPLGYLAALGALCVAHRTGEREARLKWTRQATWRPVLTGLALTERGELCRQMAAVLRGKDVPEEADKIRAAAKSVFEVAKTCVKDKRVEIQKRKLDKQERATALEQELAPLEAEREIRREEFLAALRVAVPSPELALGQRIDCTSDEYRSHAEDSFRDAGSRNRDAIDLLAAFANESVTDRGKVVPTPFCFITGSGHQFFLETVRQLMALVTPERIAEALFEAWRYRDEKLSMRWDPMDNRQYALLDRDPTAADNRSQTVWMANLLAYRSLCLFPLVMQRGALAATGWSLSREDRPWQWTWPIWEFPIGIDCVRSLLQLRELQEARPDHARLRALGVSAVFRASRIKVGQGANFKLNFTPARGV
ncbi:MAG TPA: hypothetical protein PK668_05105 [Myxococcota bacterium]|nr:hypothetical protein [Myxococcota bacterium]HRY92236.1 hypothetical protein [Myxococcota bacterium]